MKKRIRLIAQIKEKIRLIAQKQVSLRVLTRALIIATSIYLLIRPQRYMKLTEDNSVFSNSDLPPDWSYSSIILLAVLLMALIWWALQVIPKKQARALQKPESPIVIGEQKVGVEAFTYTQQSAVKPTELFSIENEARKTLSQIIGGFVVIIGLLLTGANLAITQREAEKNRSLALEGQITDRFTKAITQLGDGKLEVRLGGIYALERIAKDSEKDHWTIMEVLTAYVREHAPIKKLDDGMNPSSNKRARNTKQEDDAILPTEIQAILTVIGRRKIFVERDKDTLYLAGTCLSKADLSKANLRKANLGGVDLSGSSLFGADLSDANLMEADLSGTHLMDANLGGALLSMAKLSRAFFDEANLSLANLYKADLSGAILFAADLERALLNEANFSDANLSKANLSGTDLSKVMNLSWEQVSQAIIDENTKLPDEIESKHKDELKAMREKRRKEIEGK